MKRIICLLVLTSLLLLAGCAREDEGSRLSFGEGVSELTVVKAGEFDPLTVEGDEASEILEMLGEIYYEAVEDISEEDVQGLDFKYRITVGDSEVIVTENGFLLFEDGAYRLCEIVRGEFRFLDELSFTESPKTLGAMFGFDIGEVSEIIYTAGEVSVDIGCNKKLRELITSSLGRRAPGVDGEGVRYSLSLANIYITVFEDGKVVCQKESELYDLSGFEEVTDYLDTLIGEESKLFEQFTADQSIKVYNADKLCATIGDSAEFLSTVENHEVLMIGQRKHYELGARDYAIVIGDATVGVYGRYILLGDSVYLLRSGDFNFLKGLSYESDSGELPWI